MTAIYQRMAIKDKEQRFSLFLSFIPYNILSSFFPVSLIAFQSLSFLFSPFFFLLLLHIETVPSPLLFHSSIPLLLAYFLPYSFLISSIYQSYNNSYSCIIAIVCWVYLEHLFDLSRINEKFLTRSILLFILAPRFACTSQTYRNCVQTCKCVSRCSCLSRNCYQK